jgi:hypothetical protein
MQHSTLLLLSLFALRHLAFPLLPRAQHLQVSHLLAQHLLRLCSQAGREFLLHLLLLDKKRILRGDGASTLFRYPIFGRVGGLGRVGRFGGFSFDSTLSHDWEEGNDVVWVEEEELSCWSQKKRLDECS